MLLSFMSFLHILDINPFLELLFADIICYKVGCLFVLLVVSFAVQKLSGLMQSHSFILPLLPLPLGSNSSNVPKTKVCKYSTYVPSV